MDQNFNQQNFGIQNDQTREIGRNLSNMLNEINRRVVVEDIINDLKNDKIGEIRFSKDDLRVDSFKSKDTYENLINSLTII